MKSCFMKEQPAEYYFVKYKGEVIATLRDLTCRERDFLINKYVKSDSYHEFEVARLLKMLGVDFKVGEEGWIYSEKPTIETLEKLSVSDSDLYYTLLGEAEKAAKNYKENSEAILKNLNKQSSST